MQQIPHWYREHLSTTLVHAAAVGGAGTRAAPGSSRRRRFREDRGAVALVAVRQQLQLTVPAGARERVAVKLGVAHKPGVERAQRRVQQVLAVVVVGTGLELAGRNTCAQAAHEADDSDGRVDKLFVE